MIFNLLTTAERVRAGDRGDLADDAVDPCTDDDAPALRHEVDVRGAQVEGLRDGAVDEQDGGRLVIDVDVLADRLALLVLLRDARELDRRTLVQPVDGDLDRVLRRHADRDGDAERETQLVGEDDIRRVGHGNEHRAVVLEPQRDGAVASREVLGQQRRGLDVERLERDVQVGQLVLLCEHDGDLLLGAVPVLDKDLAEADLGRAALDGKRELELLSTDDPVSNEQRAECRPRIPRGFHESGYRQGASLR